MSAFNLASILAHHADRFPVVPASEWGRDDQRAEPTGAPVWPRRGSPRWASDAGVVALLLYNCPEFFEAMFAVARLGAVVMPLNWRLAGAESPTSPSMPAPR